MPTESAKSYSLARKMLNHVLAVEHFQMPAAVYLALYPSDPGDGVNASAELSAGGYQRTRIAFSPATELGTMPSANSLPPLKTGEQSTAGPSLTSKREATRSITVRSKRRGRS